MISISPTVSTGIVSSRVSIKVSVYKIVGVFSSFTSKESFFTLRAVSSSVIGVESGILVMFSVFGAETMVAGVEGVL